jgi:hypothetical protein
MFKLTHYNKKYCDIRPDSVKMEYFFAFFVGNYGFGIEILQNVCYNLPEIFNMEDYYVI